MVDKRFVHTAA